VYSHYNAVAVADLGYGVKLVALTLGAVNCCAKPMMNWEMSLYLSLWSEEGGALQRLMSTRLLYITL
jgi:hypothetical protein